MSGCPASAGLCSDVGSCADGNNSSSLRIGDRAPDGTIYAGMSADSGKPIYTTPSDAPFACTFDQAREYTGRLGAHGHCDWRVPTKAELGVLVQNRAAIGASARLARVRPSATGRRRG